MPDRYRALIRSGFALLFAVVALHPARAQSTDPASATIAKFYATLTDTMKHGNALGIQGRIDKMTPAVEAAFDLPLMAQFAVGPGWGAMAQPDRMAVIAAFRRYTVADYAHNFDSYSGEQFAIDPNVIARDPDRIVQTKLIPAKGDSVALNYRMRSIDGGWKIVDVFLDGYVSELATRRADYATTVAAGGGPALTKKLNDLSSNLEK